LTFIITEKNINEEICSHTFENPSEKDYVTCSNDICTKPHKFILQDGKNVHDGDSFFCHGNEKKGNTGVQPDRCFRQFFISKK
jgi:hypothetical protein